VYYYQWCHSYLWTWDYIEDTWDVCHYSIMGRMYSILLMKLYMETFETPMTRIYNRSSPCSWFSNLASVLGYDRDGCELGWQCLTMNRLQRFCLVESIGISLVANETSRQHVQLSGLWPCDLIHLLRQPNWLVGWPNSNSFHLCRNELIRRVRFVFA